MKVQNAIPRPKPVKGIYIDENREKVVGWDIDIDYILKIDPEFELRSILKHRGFHYKLNCKSGVRNLPPRISCFKKNMDDLNEVNRFD
jgi:hypothetical protein